MMTNPSTTAGRLLSSILRPFRSMRPLALSLLLLVIISFVSFNYYGDYTGLSSSASQGVPAKSGGGGGSASNGDAEVNEAKTEISSSSSSSSGGGGGGDNDNTQPVSLTQGTLSIAQLSTLNATATLFADFPLGPPYRTVYGELGSRAQVLAGWLSVADRLALGPSLDQITASIDSMAQSLFPYLLPTTPLSTLRASYAPGSKGIVIPAGGKPGFRFCSHLVGSLRRVFNTTLPITIAYAGDTDFPPSWRTALLSQPDLEDIHFLDLIPLFNNTILHIAPQAGSSDPASDHAGWASKPLAILAAPYESVLLLDADAVLLQSPTTFFTHPSFLSKGALLYHDRLIFQHAYQERLEWWHSQILHPSSELPKSKMWTEEYPEEGDSGALVINKSLPNTLAGILHAGWQNSFAQREETTYKISYGDKESYWLGLELAGATYEFSSHYGAMVGWPASEVLVPETDENGDTIPVDTREGNRICSFTIAHTDDKGKLLWLNGSLLLAKLRSETEFRTPTHWMLDGKWQKGHAKNDFSCMVDEQAREIPQDQKQIFDRSIEVAQELDRALGDLVF